jgi:hypothetical protein
MLRLAEPRPSPVPPEPGQSTRDTNGHTTAGGYASSATASDGTTCTCGMNTAPVRAACQVSPVWSYFDGRGCWCPGGALNL